MTSETKKKVVDYLKENPPVPGQNWGVYSFVSPTDEIAAKTLFCINRFMVSNINQEFAAQCQHVSRFVNAQTAKRWQDTIERLRASVNPDDKIVLEILTKTCAGLQVPEAEIVTECTRKYSLDDTVIMDKYEMYLSENRKALYMEYDDKNGSKTSVRGFKCSGNYETIEAAREKAKEVSQLERAVNVFIGPVGKWVPVDVTPDGIQCQEYMLPELNQLMKKYNDNVAEKNVHFAERTREMQQAAEQDRVSAAKERCRKKLIAQKNAALEIEQQTFLRMHGHELNTPAAAAGAGADGGTADEATGAREKTKTKKKHSAKDKERKRERKERKRLEKNDNNN